MGFLNIRFGSRLGSFTAVAIALSLTASGCRPGNNSAESELNSAITLENLENNQTLVRNEPKGIQLITPNSWEQVDNLRPDADIYIANEPENTYVMVLVDSLSATVQQFTLSDNASQYRRVLVDQLDTYNGQTATSITSVNGQPAEQYEIRGEIDGTAIVYVHTTIRGEENYYQVVGWTRDDQYDARRQELQQVITSFRGV
ncbi:MAG: hypothetical protein AAF921_00310 [Cyanobacteria bacterium P01_D01_bin.44]